ncbi:MAG: cysteine hydrolase [Solirubrobacterales bacterium]|nr:cysteine hydrolase [Solirubrobacterales bacterium]MBV9166312.1 cysteine hydrolase [Solirubrobacterales bacterium]
MPQALIVIDMLNRYEHEDAEPLMRSVREVLPAIEGLIGEARERDVLTVWVNDNHGDWTAGRDELVGWARGGRDGSLIEPIAPSDDQPFVVKARHSIFYGTQLEYLLRTSDIDRIVLAGQVTEQCILYSALDGYVRHFDVSIPRDAVAHIVPELADAALHMMERNMRAHVIEAAGVLDPPQQDG